MKFTDSHCHLDFPEFAANLPALIQQCAQADIHQIIIPAIHPDNWQKVLDIAHIQSLKPCSVVPKAIPKVIPKVIPKTCKLFPCLGIHPWFLEGLNQTHLDQLALMVDQNKTHLVAIGETGIDGAIVKQQQLSNQQENLAKQLLFFDFQLTLAHAAQLPIIVHHRQSHQHILPLLKQHKLEQGGVIHAFSGSYQQAVNYLDLGFKLGVGGTITYPRAKKTINAIKRLPLESLVLETDAPSMPLANAQGKINSPLNVIDVFTQLAQIRHEDKSRLAEQLALNINNLFKRCISV